MDNPVAVIDVDPRGEVVNLPKSRVDKFAILDDDKNPLDEEVIDEDQDQDDEDIDIVDIKEEEKIDNKSISQHRKAYVKWVNEIFYKELKKNIKYEKSTLKIYQYLVKSYLNTILPYRGLLIYHGLGTGKTATSISLAESLSSQLDITTLLPASLEGNFISEVMGDPNNNKKGWGWNELQIDQMWSFKDIKTWTSTDTNFKRKYNSETVDKANKLYRKIVNRAITNIKKLNIEDEKTKINDIKKHEKGLFEPSTDGIKYDDLSDTQKYLLESQIEIFVSIKYNFIHYKPLPTITKTKNRLLKEFEEESDSDDDLLIEEDKKVINTNNKRIIVDLEKKLKHNIQNYNIYSPFYKQVIIIDEVHNFVRQILNNSIRTKIFYEWILKAEQVKLVFLSGTPIINKPCEIAILFNMLKGIIKIYTFEIDTDKNYEEVNILCEKFFYEKSDIELHNVLQENGKIYISIIPQVSNFESLLDENDNIVYTIQNNTNELDFFSTIYDKLHKIFDKDSIKPSQKDFLNLSIRDKKAIIRGSKKVSIDLKENDKAIFNKHIRLFDVSVDNKIIDMTNHDNFMNYFFENESTIHPKKRILLKRMLMGLTSFYQLIEHLL